MAYFLYISGERKGPHEVEEIKAMVTAGKVRSDDLVWDDAGRRWMVIGEFPPLASLFGKPASGDYIINVDGKTGGPFDEEAIKNEIEKGRFLGSHYIWDDKEVRWVEARYHPVFSAYFEKEAPPETACYIAKDGKREGPLPFEEVERRIIARELAGDDFVFDSILERWVFLKETERFGALFKVTAPPAPPPPKPVVEQDIETLLAAARTPPPERPETKREPAVTAPGDIINLVTGPGTTGPAVAVSPSGSREAAAPGAPPPAVEEALPRRAEAAAPVEAPQKKARPATFVSDEETGVFKRTRPSPVRRLIAQLIDVGFISLSFLVILMIMSAAGMNPYAEGPRQETYRAGAYISFGIIVLAYLLFRDGFGGASIGKKILGLTVVRGPSASPIDPVRSFVRNLFLLIPILNLVELFYVITDEDGRRIGDRAAGCVEMYGAEVEYIRYHGLEAAV